MFFNDEFSWTGKLQRRNSSQRLVREFFGAYKRWFIGYPLNIIRKVIPDFCRETPGLGIEGYRNPARTTFKIFWTPKPANRYRINRILHQSDYKKLPPEFRGCNGVKQPGNEPGTVTGNSFRDHAFFEKTAVFCYHAPKFRNFASKLENAYWSDPG